MTFDLTDAPLAYLTHRLTIINRLVGPLIGTPQGRTATARVLIEEAHAVAREMVKRSGGTWTVEDTAKVWKR